MRAVAQNAAALGEELGGAHNVLVLAPAVGPSDTDACSSLLSVVPAERADVLCVTFNHPPDARLERWQGAGGPADPAELGFIVVGDGVRSGTVATAPSEVSVEELGPTVGAVSSPGDLTGLMITIGDFFTDWAADGNRVLLCFHTLTTCLQYADVRTVYRFINTLTGRVQSAGAIAHYHLDPTAHDERTVNTFLGLFDAAVQAGGDGTWDVRRRR